MGTLYTDWRGLLGVLLSINSALDEKPAQASADP